MDIKSHIRKRRSNITNALLIKSQAEGESNQGTLGTPFIWEPLTLGGVRCRNFQYNQELYCDEIEPEALDEACHRNNGPYHMAGCFGCQVHCRAKYKIPTGPYAGVYDEGPEYTSKVLFVGTRLPELETLLVGNHLVDQWGMDNLEPEALSPGRWNSMNWESLLTKRRWLDLRFGNDEALLEMVKRICFRKGWLGDILAEGGIIASEKIGRIRLTT